METLTVEQQAQLAQVAAAQETLNTFDMEMAQATLAAIEAEVEPLRTEREALSTQPINGMTLAQVQQRQTELSAQINEKEKPMGQLKKAITHAIRTGRVPGQTVKVEQAQRKMKEEV